MEIIIKITAGNEGSVATQLIVIQEKLKRELRSQQVKRRWNKLEEKTNLLDYQIYILNDDF